jgi:hypothetical protein
MNKRPEVNWHFSACEARSGITGRFRHTAWVKISMQSCGPSISAQRGKEARFNISHAHTELRTKRQRSAREAIYRKRPIQAV